MKLSLTPFILLLSLAGCAGPQPGNNGQSSSPSSTMIPQATGKTLVFECADPDGGDFQFTVRTGPGELAVWLPERFGERYLVLGQERAASGARYRGGGVMVWTHGDEAMLEVDGQSFTGCQNLPPLESSVDAGRHETDFCALSQGRGWYRELRETAQSLPRVEERRKRPAHERV